MKKETQQDSEIKTKTGTKTAAKSEECKPGKDKTEKTKEDIREGRKSLTMPKSYDGKNKVRYIEGTKALKDGCWLSDK